MRDCPDGSSNLACLPRDQDAIRNGFCRDSEEVVIGFRDAIEMRPAGVKTCTARAEKAWRTTFKIRRETSCNSDPSKCLFPRFVTLFQANARAVRAAAGHGHVYQFLQDILGMCREYLSPRVVGRRRAAANLFSSLLDRETIGRPTGRGTPFRYRTQGSPSDFP